MSYQRKPSNWYSMSYDEQRTWERNDRQLEDLDYEKDRAQQDADHARREAERQAQNAKDLRRDLCEQSDRIENLAGEVRGLIALVKRLRDFIAQETAENPIASELVRAADIAVEDRDND